MQVTAGLTVERSLLVSGVFACLDHTSGFANLCCEAMVWGLSV